MKRRRILRGSWSVFLALAAVLVGAASATARPQDANTTTAKSPIIVTAPVSEAERRKQLRRFTRAIVRSPRKGRPIARFRFPICPQVKGIAPEDARAVEARLRENAEAFASGANRDPGCTPNLRVAFMAPAAGAPEAWLTEKSDQLAHLPIYQRRTVLAEQDPVRSWSKVALRDIDGQPLRSLEADGRVIGQGDPIPTLVEPFSSADPIYTTEITGAAILIEREAAENLTLAQLADYITMRTFLGTQSPSEEVTPAAATTLSLFKGGEAPGGLTLYDQALLESVYKASRQSTPRKVIANTASTTARTERRRSDEGSR